MNNLENLRKQAKQYVRWHRERVWTVAQVIRETLPRYAGRTDGQILDATFQLADAQEIVSRRAGFEGWEALVASFRDDASPRAERANEPAEPPRVLVARPFVFVRDVRAACAYYVDTLGFELAFDYGSPPFYAEIARDGVRICVRHTDEAVVDPDQAQREDLVVTSLEVSDARALYQEMQEAGAVFAQTLRVEPYGTRSFIVTDPDGNRILFFDAYAVSANHRRQDSEGRTLGPE